MKRLDLNAYAVEEMSNVAMRKTEGGHPIAWLILGILISECLDRNAPKDFADGQQAYKDSHNK
jgi:hypothetical protein